MSFCFQFRDIENLPVDNSMKYIKYLGLNEVLKYYFFKRVCVCVCVCVCVHMHLPHVCGYPWRLKEGIRYPGSGVTGSCEAPKVGAGN